MWNFEWGRGKRKSAFFCLAGKAKMHTQSVAQLRAVTLKTRPFRGGDPTETPKLVCVVGSEGLGLRSRIFQIVASSSSLLVCRRTTVVRLLLPSSFTPSLLLPKAARPAVALSPRNLQTSILPLSWSRSVSPRAASLAFRPWQQSSQDGSSTSLSAPIDVRASVACTDTRTIHTGRGANLVLRPIEYCPSRSNGEWHVELFALRSSRLRLASTNASGPK